MTHAFARYGLVAAAAALLALAAQPAFAAAAVDLECNGCVSKDDLGNNAKPGGIDFVDGHQNLLLATASMVVRSITVKSPEPGFVVVNASGVFRLWNMPLIAAACSITEGSIIEPEQTDARIITGDGQKFLPFHITRAFEVKKGKTTFNLACQSWEGTAYVRNTSMTAIFAPTIY